MNPAPPSAASRPSISIVVPAFNEAGNIEAVVREALDVLAHHADRFEVIVGDDGSRDGTGDVVERLAAADPRVRLLRKPVNGGVARMCRDLYRASRCDLVAFFPGDGQVPPREIVPMLAARDRFDVVVGWRRDRKDPFHRIVNAAVWNLATRILFGLRVRDIDSVKLWPGEFLRSAEIVSETPFMETELLVRARQAGLRIGNADVGHQPRTYGIASGARLGVIFSSLAELARFRLRGGRPGPASPGRGSG